jgi:hypothetical protein
MRGIFEQSKAGVFNLFYFYNIQNLEKFNKKITKVNFTLEKKLQKEIKFICQKWQKYANSPYQTQLSIFPDPHIIQLIYIAN